MTFTAIIEKIRILCQTNNDLLSIAIIIFSGILLGAFMLKLKLPEITGYILTGILLGKSGLKLFPESFIESLQTINHIALGLMAFIIGTHVNFHKLKNSGKRVIFCFIGEEAATFSIVFFLFLFIFQFHPVFALLIATISISTAPATTVAIVKETKAKGTLINTLMPAVAINAAVCIALFDIFLNIAKKTGPNGLNTSGEIFLIFFNSILTICFSIILGVIIGYILKVFTEKDSKSEGEMLTFVFLLVIASTGLSNLLSINPMLPSLVTGIFISNATIYRKKIIDVLERVQHLILLVFFVMAGMHFDSAHLANIGILGAGYFLARATGKILGGSLGSRIGKSPERISKYIGFTLIPQSGVAIGLTILASQVSYLSDDIDLLITIVLATVTLNEIVGPVLAKWAITMAGEANQDRPKLIEFIGEEYVKTDIKAENKKDAIAEMVSFLIKSHGMDMARFDKLFNAVLERESQLSTGIGNGIAVPHGIITTEGDPYVLGAIGLSKKGIPFNAPDNKPVRLIILVITPHEHRNKHLKILSEISRMLNKDKTREAIFQANSPAELYEILRSFEMQDFNYFIN